MEKNCLNLNLKTTFRFLWIISFVFVHTSLTAQEDTTGLATDTSVAQEASDTSEAIAQGTTGDTAMAEGDTTMVAADTAPAGSASDSLIAEYAEDDHHDDHGYDYGLKRGERLFHGLIRVNGNDGVNCASCHNTTYIDTLNWNPSAYEISLTSAYMDSAEFAAALLDPFGTARLEEAHQGIELSGEDIELVQLYLQDVAEEGLQEPMPSINKLLQFIGLLLIIIFVLIDLTTKKILKFKAIHLTIILIATYFIIEMVAQEAIALGRSEGYAPLQPVKFSHQVHAGQNQTDCQYCHHTAEESKSAGIPSVSLCMNCHLVVREGSRTGAFEINKIWQAMSDSVSIEWTRIHRLPDHVYFSHAQHVGAGKLDCAECHGEVEEMHVLQQVSDLSMGWCLDCHRTRSVQFLENDYYETYEEYHEAIKSGQIDSVTVAAIGGTECMKCHY